MIIKMLPKGCWELGTKTPMTTTHYLMGQHCLPLYPQERFTLDLALSVSIVQRTTVFIRSCLTLFNWTLDSAVGNSFTCSARVVCDIRKLLSFYIFKRCVLLGSLAGWFSLPGFSWARTFPLPKSYLQYLCRVFEENKFRLLELTNYLRWQKYIIMYPYAEEFLAYSTHFFRANQRNTIFVHLCSKWKRGDLCKVWFHTHVRGRHHVV